MLFQAHRGVSTEFPENTMPAFRAAWQQGYQIIELDPSFTKDRQCVVFHDATVNRTCRTRCNERIQEERRVCELSYDELLAYDAGSYMGPQFKGTKVPLLSEALAFAAETGILVKLDNKFEKFNAQQQEVFFRIVEESNARVAFTCAHVEMIRLVTSRFPNAEIHYDGFVDEKTVLAVKSLLRNNDLTVWLPLPSKLTSWVRVPVASADLCKTVRCYAKLGLWLLETEEQLEKATFLGADIVETTGAIKPR